MKNFLTYIPFSSPWIIRHNLGDMKTILDVGCGDGSMMLKINFDNKYDVTGIDLYSPYLRMAKGNGVYKKIVKGSIKNMKFKNRSFDAVLASQVIEHISKREGIKMIKEMERIAKKKVIIATPKGFVPFEPFEKKDNNPLQVHKSGWEIDEMRKYGYKIYGQGSGFIYKPTGLLYKFRNLKNIFIIISFLLSPLTYLAPNTSSIIVAVKNK